MVIKITPMTLADIPQIEIIEKVSFPIPWSREAFLDELFKNENAFYLVAKNEAERVCGYVGVWFILDEGHITNVAVHPDFRRQKIATMLIRELIEKALAKKLSFLTLEVRASNQVAQKTYRNLGFEPLGFRKKYYLDNNEDALIMQKNL